MAQWQVLAFFTVGEAMSQIVGLVVKKAFAVGSKSERSAVMLDSTDGTSYVLRRRGGNAFQDPMLEALVGKRIHCSGTVNDEHHLILADSWEIVAE